jgi:hypothetical protein
MFMVFVLIFVCVASLLVGLTVGAGIGMRIYAEQPRPSTPQPVADKTIHMETITIDSGKFYKKI